MELIPITEPDKQEICGWHYQGLYQIYNLPSYAEMKVSSMGFASPEKEKNFYIWRENGHLIGYVNLLEKPDGIFIGIGIQPTLCGQHYGRRLLTEAVRLAQELYPGKTLYLEVRTWNQRAVRCYEHVGFVLDGAPYTQTTGVGTDKFYRMVFAGKGEAQCP